MVTINEAGAAEDRALSTSCLQKRGGLLLGEKDVAEKTLEMHNDVFADIANGFLFGGEQVIREEALVDTQHVSMYKADGKIRSQERDVSKYWVRNSDSGEEARITLRVAFLGIE